jgi:hypothetical protein
MLVDEVDIVRVAKGKQILFTFRATMQFYCNSYEKIVPKKDKKIQSLLLKRSA